MWRANTYIHTYIHAGQLIWVHSWQMIWVHSWQMNWVHSWQMVWFHRGAKMALFVWGINDKNNQHPTNIAAVRRWPYLFGDQNDKNGKNLTTIFPKRIHQRSIISVIEMFWALCRSTHFTLIPSLHWIVYETQCGSFRQFHILIVSLLIRRCKIDWAAQSSLAYSKLQEWQAETSSSPERLQYNELSQRDPN